MKHQDMNPKIWKELVAAKIKRDKNLTQVDMSAATDEFKCFKCEKDNALIISYRPRVRMNQ